MTAPVARLTSDWTDRHASVAVALVMAVVVGTALAREPFPYLVVGVVVGVLTVLLALRLDAFGGIVTGVVGAAAVILAKQMSGGWTGQAFLTSLATTLAVVGLGWATGAAGVRLRYRGSDPSSHGLVAPSEGSLGLLTGDLAVARLEEEMGRARRHRRPLAVLLLRTEILDVSLGPAARQGAFRSVARLVETLLRETDVPFALGPDEVGAILPETDAATAWELVGPLVEAITGATFSVREAEDRRSFADAAELHVGLTAMTAQHTSGSELLAAARRAVESEADGSPDAAGTPRAMPA